MKKMHHSAKRTDKGKGYFPHRARYPKNHPKPLYQKTTPKNPKNTQNRPTPHQQRPQNTHHKNTKPPDKAKGTKTYTQTQHQKTKKNNRTPGHLTTRHPPHYHPYPSPYPTASLHLLYPSTLSSPYPYLTLYYPTPCLAFPYPLLPYCVCSV